MIRRILLFWLTCMALLWGSVAIVLALVWLYESHPVAAVLAASGLGCLIFSVLKACEVEG